MAIDFAGLLDRLLLPALALIVGAILILSGEKEVGLMLLGFSIGAPLSTKPVKALRSALS